jgi:hypothetical protein
MRVRDGARTRDLPDHNPTNWGRVRPEGAFLYASGAVRSGEIRSGQYPAEYHGVESRVDRSETAQARISQRRAWRSAPACHRFGQNHGPEPRLSVHLGVFSLIFSIDHVVFSATTEQRDAISEALAAAGFVSERFTLDFPESGASSDSLSFAGGGFVEFVVETDPAHSNDLWFGAAPRVIGLGFASNSFDADTQPWDWPGAWRMDEDHVLPDGDVLNIHAAGPHVHQSEFYVFVMERDAGAIQFPGTSARARLEEIRVRGVDAGRWCDDLSKWLGIAASDDTLAVGDVKLRFERGPEPGVEATLVFSGSGSEKTTIPLARGAIVIDPR